MINSCLFAWSFVKKNRHVTNPNRIILNLNQQSKFLLSDAFHKFNKAVACRKKLFYWFSSFLSTTNHLHFHCLLVVVIRLLNIKNILDSICCDPNRNYSRKRCFTKVFNSMANGSCLVIPVMLPVGLSTLGTVDKSPEWMKPTILRDLYMYGFIFITSSSMSLTAAGILTKSLWNVQRKCCT